MDWLNNDKTDWLSYDAETRAKLLEAKVKREMRLERERKHKEKREMFDTIFPEFQGMPVIWIVISILCILVSVFSMII